MGGFPARPIYLCGAAYLMRLLARTRFQFVRKGIAGTLLSTSSLSRKSVRGSNPLRATDAMFTRDSRQSLSPKRSSCAPSPVCRGGTESPVRSDDDIPSSRAR